MLKNLPAMQEMLAGDVSSIPGSGRSPGAGNDILLQYSSLGNPRDSRSCGLQSKGLQKSWT